MAKAAADRTPKRERQKGTPFPLPLDTSPMEARSDNSLPAGEGVWQYEPKWDGFRCLAFKSGGAVELRAKSGKPLGRYFPEIVALFEALEPPDFVVDGEIVITLDGEAAFDALQMRLHPAESRIRKLSRETPAEFVAFDILATPDGGLLVDEPLSERRRVLEEFLHGLDPPETLRLSPATPDLETAARWLAEAGDGPTDGVVAKRLDGAYAPGERAMVKVKRLRTADCVVGGFRYESKGSEVGSLLLGLYDADG